jgi:hypothetical protein
MTQAGAFDSGLTGTIGYTVYEIGGTVSRARTTVGITETPAGSGIYRAAPTLTVATGDYVVWDDGAGTYANEALGGSAGLTTEEVEILQRVAAKVGAYGGTQARSADGTITEVMVRPDGDHLTCVTPPARTSMNVSTGD